MTPTTELETPEAKRASINRPAAPTPRSGARGPIGRLDLCGLVARTIVECDSSHRDHCHIDQAGDAERQQHFAIRHLEGFAPRCRVREGQTRLCQTRVKVYGVRQDRGTDNADSQTNAARPIQMRDEHTGRDSAPVRRRDHQLHEVAHRDHADKAAYQDLDGAETPAL